LAYTQILQLALIQWRQIFFPHIQARLTGAILNLIERQRSGETIDQGLFKKVVDSFISFGIDEGDLNMTYLGDYKLHFERPFLAATETYYKKESWRFYAETSVSGYLKKTEECLQAEEDRVERYLHTSTRKPLITLLVRIHASFMSEDFQNLLDCDNYEELQRMYSVLSRSTEGLEPLQRQFEKHATRTGLAAVSTLVGTDPAAIEALEPNVYVDALLEVHTTLTETVNRCFEGEAGFIASLDRACREFVNRNAVTGTSSRKSPELLAKHVDALLRRNSKVSEEDDLEDALNRVVRRFRSSYPSRTIYQRAHYRLSFSGTSRKRTFSRHSIQ
jgi:cullin 1